MNIQPTVAVLDVEADVSTLHRDGIIGRKGAFSREFADAMREDMMTAFWKAIQRPGGAVGRGPAPLVCRNPPGGIWRLCRTDHASMGRERWPNGCTRRPDYQIVEIGFDTPFPGREVSALAS